jgi:ubiquinone/menaquinone biosynthesis C-methylase UbiE
MSATLAYAKRVDHCLAECARILKTGGRIVFGATYSPDDNEFHGNQVSGEEIVQILRKLGLQLFYYAPNEKTNGLGHRQTSHIFGARKLDGSAVPQDPVSL